MNFRKLTFDEKENAQDYLLNVEVLVNAKINEGGKRFMTHAKTQIKKK